MDIEFKKNKKSEFIVLDTDSTEVMAMLNRKVNMEKVPSVVGMGLRDAIYVLGESWLECRSKWSRGKWSISLFDQAQWLRGQTVALRLN